jgi:hypothetical protein
VIAQDEALSGLRQDEALSGLRQDEALSCLRQDEAPEPGRLRVSTPPPDISGLAAMPSPSGGYKARHLPFLEGEGFLAADRGAPARLWLAAAVFLVCLSGAVLGWSR